MSKKTYLMQSCYLCGIWHQHDHGLCLACSCILPRLGEHCKRCAIPLSVEQALCAQCLQQQVSFNKTTIAFRYQWPIPWCIQQFKEQGKLNFVQFLAEPLIAQLANQVVPELIISVPMHRQKLKQRGFNQSVVLANYLSKKLSIKTEHFAMAKHKDSQIQKQLTRKARFANMRNSFLQQKPIVANSVAIVDDVVTTTATTQALASLLKKQGVKHIEVWAIARA